jgi:23S rRNA pseudouridine2457 synthase
MPGQPHRYFVVNKPYRMVSQFVSTHAVRLLGDLNYPFPEGTHAIGRLDNNSEGLLILTTNKKVTRLLFLGEVPHRRTYLVQVNNLLGEEQLSRLKNGVSIRIAGGAQYITPPCEVEIVPDPSAIYAGAVADQSYGVHTWLLVTITEGKYHQVRKMIGAVRHRCKRLIRVSIEELVLGNLEPGGVREIEEAAFFSSLNIPHPVPNFEHHS